MIRVLAFVFTLFLLPFTTMASDAQELYLTLRSKVLAVKDYTADVRVLIDVSYMQIPTLEGILYYKAPDKVKMVRKDGISMLPKKNISLTLGSLIPSGGVTVLDAGTATIKGHNLRILKVIPDDDKTGIVLTRIWVDEAALLAYRTETTTRDEGTVVLDLEYGSYARYALPDKVSITMDVKEYKLPKGATMDYSEAPGTPKKPVAAGGKNEKGRIDITYLSYKVNKGLSDSIFADKDK